VTDGLRAEITTRSTASIFVSAGSNTETYNADKRGVLAQLRAATIDVRIFRTGSPTI